MKAAAILENKTRGWNRDPEYHAQGSDPEGLSAALWSSPHDSSDEVTAHPLDDQHIVCLQFIPVAADFWQDDRLIYSGQYAAGDVAIVPTRVRHRAVMYGRYACLHLYVPTKLLSAIVRQEGGEVSSGGVEIVDHKRMNDPVIHRIGSDMVFEMRSKMPLSRLRVDALGLDLAVHLLRRYSGEGGSWMRQTPAARGGLAPWQIRRCEEIFASDLSHSHSLSTLAGELGLSPFHFARSFKHSTGVPPHTYLTGLRMERAKTLLTGTNLPITEIAFQVGYESNQAFSRVFKKKFQCSPRDFRRNAWW